MPLPRPLNKMEEHAPHSTTDSQDLLDPQDLEEEEDPEIEPHSIKDKQPWSWKGVLLGLLCVIFLHLAKICGKLVLIHSSLLGGYHMCCIHRSHR